MIDDNMDQILTPKSVPFSNNLKKVYEYMVTRGGQPDRSIPIHMKYSLDKGEIRIQNNVLGTLLRAKPNDAGAWVVRGWLSSYGCSGWQRTSATDLVLHVAEAMKPNLIVETSGDYLEDSNDGYWNVECALDKIMLNAAHNRDRKILYSRIPGLILEGGGGSNPYQADGTWNGYSFYFRFRHGWASLSIGREIDQDGNEDNLNLIQNPYWFAGIQYESEDDGDLTVPQFTDLFCKLGKMLEIQPFKYEFRPINAGEKDPSAWVEGWDAQEARATIKDYSFYNDKEYELEPVTEDYRVYPWPMDEFIVLD